MSGFLKREIDFVQSIVRDLFRVAASELRLTLRDAGVVIFFIVVPLAYPLIYAYIYNNESVHDVPVVVIDDSNSRLSRDFVFRCDASSDVRVVAKVPDMESAKELLYRKEAYGIIWIPSDFSKNINERHQSHVSLYCDLSSLLFYKSILLTTTDVSLEMGNEIEVSNLSPRSVEQDERTKQPIISKHVSLFNSQGGFASFLVVAILIIIIQQTLLLGVGMLEGTHRYLGGLAPIRTWGTRRFGGTFRLVMGKSLAYFTIYSITSCWLVFAIPHLFDLPQIGNRAMILHFMLPYLLSCIFFAMAVSKCVRDREATFVLFVFTSVLLLFISGVSWLPSSMPPFWRGFSYIFPSTSGIQGFVKLNSMGASLWEVRQEYFSLWGLTFFYLILACCIFHRERGQI